jgi:predicted ATPase
VITGSVSSGKTTLIDQIADQGFQTVAETGRQYFEIEMARGRTRDEIFGNETDQRRIEDIKLRTERGLPAMDVAFLDRGLPDAITLRRAGGLNPNEALVKCFHHRYASIFLLDQLPLQKDGLRIDDNAIAGFLDEWLARDYSALGYSVVRVPVMSIKDRLAFIFEKLS